MNRQLPNQPTVMSSAHFGGISTHSSDQMRPRDWSTGMFACMEDEETCWWTIWCPYLVTARTWDQFNLCDSIKFVVPMGILYIFWLYSFIWGSGYGMLLLGIFWLCVYPGLMAFKRQQIRQKLRINEDWCGSDFATHFCCDRCAVAQEAREGIAAGVAQKDFCFGQALSEFPVSSLSSEHPLVDGRDGSLAGKESEESIMLPGTDMLKLSKTSKAILWVVGIILSAAVCTMFAVGNGGQVVVLFFILAQPVVVMYFCYYRTMRDNIALDYVIKLFAVGFFLTTFQSVWIEEALQLILLMIASPYLLQALGITATGDFGDPDSQSAVQISRSVSQVMKNISGTHSPMPKIMNYVYTWTAGTLSHAAAEADPDNPLSPENLKASLPKLIRAHWAMALVACFLMAYIVAAGTEETMKHFIVRCYRFGSPLKDPYTTTVFFLAGAAGFAAAENLSYVFGVKQSPIEGTSVVVGELTVLLMRVAMPVHLICAVMQAVNVSKIVMGTYASNMSMFRVILPAILLHGTFDFTLFVLSVLSYAEDISSTTFELFTLGLAASIGLIGMRYAWVQFKDVSRAYDFGFQALSDETEHMDMDVELADRQGM